MNSLPKAANPTAPSAEEAARGLGVKTLQVRLVVGVLVVCALAALFWPRGGRTFKEPGGFLYDLQGRPAKLGPQLAPVSLVHFWATWCPPCIEEIPALQRLSRDFSGRDDFSIVMIAVADSNEKVTTFLGPGWDMVLFDPHWDVAKRYGTEKVPETYLVVHGEVLEKFAGWTNWDDPRIREKVTQHLRSRPARTAAIPAAGS